MKKIILLSSALVAMNVSSFAQSFTIPHDTVAMSVTTTANLHNDITNTTGSDIQVVWRVTDNDLPTDWADALGICDNKLCYYNINNALLNGSSKTTNPITPTAPGNFYVVPDLTATTSTGTHFVKVKMSEGGYDKDSWYIITKSLTGVATVNTSAKKVIAYPNPATDILNIVADAKLSAANVVVYNTMGQYVANNTVTDNSAKINTSALPAGLYYIKVLGTNSEVLTTETFMKSN